MKKSILKATAVITVMVLCEKILGFIREIVQAYYFGTSEFVDSIVSANLIISVFFGWLTTISVAYTPIYKRKVISGEGEKFTNTIKTICYILSIASLLLCLVLAKQLVAIALPGFSDEKSIETVQLLFILAFSILFISSTKLNNSFLAANGYFVRSIVPSLAINIVQIVALIISFGTRKYIVAVGIVIAYLIEWIISIFLTFGTKYRFKLSLKDHDGIKELVKTIVPITITYIIDDICTFFDKMFASYLYEGSISSLAYSNSLRKVIYSVVTVLVTTILYPKVSEYLAQKDDVRARDTIGLSLRILFIVLIPVISTCVIMSNQIVFVVFERGAFNSESTNLTASSFMAYLFGLIPLSCNAIIIKYFYANKKAKYCTILSALTVGTNIVFDAIFVNSLGHTGLALATSLSVAISMPLYYYVYKREQNRKGDKRNSVVFITEKTKNSFKIIFASAICISVATITYCVRDIYQSFSQTNILCSMATITVCFIILALSMWVPLFLSKEKSFRKMISKLRINKDEQLSGGENHE